MARRTKGTAAIERKASRLKTLNVEHVPIGEVIPNTWNPNKQSDHDFELLVRSMMEDGFDSPIVVKRVTEEDRSDKDLRKYAPGQIVIVDGEHRWTGAIVVEALGQAGVTDTTHLDPKQVNSLRKRRVELLETMPDLTIPVVFTPMTPAQMRIATLRHNRARGNEDIELTSNLLHDLQELGALEWAQDSLMLDEVELGALLDDVPAPDALAGDEYSEAWQPAPTQMDMPVPEGTQVTIGMTQAAIERLRQQEEQMRTARTEEERVAVRHDNDVYRVSLVFSGEEAQLVRDVLGDKPADRMLELCRAQADIAVSGNGHVA